VEILDKLEKFIQRLEKMVDMLEEHHGDLNITSSISQFYYVQKMETLKQYQESISETVQRMKFFADQFELEYTQVYKRWKADVRWLNTVRMRLKKYEEGHEGMSAEDLRQSRYEDTKNIG
jgi:hypothetical protein